MFKHPPGLAQMSHSKECKTQKSVKNTHSPIIPSLCHSSQFNHTYQWVRHWLCTPRYHNNITTSNYYVYNTNQIARYIYMYTHSSLLCPLFRGEPARSPGKNCPPIKKTFLLEKLKRTEKPKLREIACSQASTPPVNYLKWTKHI